MKYFLHKLEVDQVEHQDSGCAECVASCGLGLRRHLVLMVDKLLQGHRSWCVGQDGASKRETSKASRICQRVSLEISFACEKWKVPSLCGSILSSKPPKAGIMLEFNSSLNLCEQVSPLQSSLQRHNSISRAPPSSWAGSRGGVETQLGSGVS